MSIPTNINISEDTDEQNLLIDDIFEPAITEHEARQLEPILISFIKKYIKNKDNENGEWLKAELSEQLPEKSEEEITEITNEIISEIKLQKDKHSSLENALKEGRSRESWFAKEMANATKNITVQESMRYYRDLDFALLKANSNLYDTIHTSSGLVNQNPALDGFIAEQHHAQTFNLNAEAKGSYYRAEALPPSSDGYTKNSVDIVIKDTRTGKIVRRYQAKYYKDAESTAQAFKDGDYRGQRKLVPDGQETDIKNSSNVIESPDGVKSKPLSKQEAKTLQEEAQSGNWNDLNWNEYKTKDLAIGIGKQAGLYGRNDTCAD